MIDTADLRSKIIDLAIQGKLTEQLPTDGTAEELYQQIQTEKVKLQRIQRYYLSQAVELLTANLKEIDDNTLQANIISTSTDKEPEQ